MSNKITSRDLSGMVGHWLGCPENGYLGSRYGNGLKDLLQSPMAAGLADGQIAKCRQDVPLLLQAPAGMLNVYAYDGDIDQKRIVFEVAGEFVEAGDPSTSIAPDRGSGDNEFADRQDLIDTVNQSVAAALNRNVHKTLPDYF